MALWQTCGGACGSSFLMREAIGETIPAMLLGRFKAAFLGACAIVCSLFGPAVSTAAPAGWVVQHSNSLPASFRGVHAVSGQVVWVSGTRGACLRTVDGGETWENHTMPGAEQLDFRGVFAFDADSAVLISSGDAEKGQTRICRTADGGRTWQTVFQTQTKGAFLDGISFWDRTNGLALGDQLDGKWFMLESADGGRTWERVAPAGLPEMQTNEGAFAAGNTSIAMQASSQVWLASGASDRARIFISTDRAQTWRVVDTPMRGGPTAGIYSLRFWYPRHAIAVGGDYKQPRVASDNVILSDDGGLTWRKGAPTDPPGLKETVVILPGNVILAVGPSGTSLSRDHAQSWQRVDQRVLHAASCADGRCWAVGDRGTIAIWRDN
jgi:photosystem II stability/assembly factor-like uncharacterized protein